MKKGLITFSIIALISVLATACGKKESLKIITIDNQINEEKTGDVLSDANDSNGESSILNENIADDQILELISVLPEISLEQIELYADQKQSILNSNESNFSLLCADGKDVYFVDYDCGAIMKKKWNGEPVVFLEREIDFIEILDNYLYIKEKGALELDRVNLDTLVFEKVYDASSFGNVVFINQDIFINSKEGFGLLKEGRINILVEPEYTITFPCPTNEWILMNAIDLDDPFVYFQGLLLAYDQQQQMLYHVTDSVVHPLITGHNLVYSEKDTGKLHVYNTESNKDTCLESVHYSAVGYEQYVFYTDSHDGEVIVNQWDGDSVEELFCITNVNTNIAPFYTLFLSENALYCVAEYGSGTGMKTDWYCYDMETEELHSLINE